jgi:hypothetical protein
MINICSEPWLQGFYNLLFAVGHCAWLGVVRISTGQTPRA